MDDFYNVSSIYRLLSQVSLLFLSQLLSIKFTPFPLLNKALIGRVGEDLTIVSKMIGKRDRNVSLWGMYIETHNKAKKNQGEVGKWCLWKKKGWEAHIGLLAKKGCGYGRILERQLCWNTRWRMLGKKDRSGFWWSRKPSGGLEQMWCQSIEKLSYVRLRNLGRQSKGVLVHQEPWRCARLCKP